MNLILIAKGNIRKKKSDMAVVLLLVALAFTLFCSSVSVLVNMEAVQDESIRRVNGADGIVATTNLHQEEILSLFREQAEVGELYHGRMLFMSGGRHEQAGNVQADTGNFQTHPVQEEAPENNFIMESMGWSSELNRLTVLEGDAETILKEDAIILPWFFKAAEGYETGDTINLTFGDRMYSFEVAGFAEDIFFSTLSNMPYVKCFVSDVMLEKLEESPRAVAGNIYLYRLKAGSSIEKFHEKISSLTGEQITDWQYGNNLILQKNSMKTGSSITAHIFLMITGVFSMLVIIIAIFIIQFSIRNSMEINLKNIGMLQAVGYTGRQLGLVAIGEIMGVTVAGMLLGFVLAPWMLLILGNIISASTGIQWNQGVDVRCALAGTALVLVLIFPCTVTAVSKYRRVTPLEALREGIRTHSFSRNNIPLSTTRLPLQAGLSVKNIFGDRKKSVTIVLITMLLVAVCNCGVILYMNFVLSADPLIQMSGIEIPETIINLSGQERTAAELDQILSGQKETDYILHFNSAGVKISHQDREIRERCEFYDRPEKLRTDKVYEGHWPAADNEIMMSVILCEELGVGLGDMVYVESEERREAYLLTGICQQISYLGRGAMMTMAGARQLFPEIDAAMLYCYAKEGVSFEEMKKTYLSACPQLIIPNTRVQTIEELRMISETMNTLCILFFVVTITVISMIIFLMTVTKLTRERRQNGIYKAMGYTTGQLIYQTVMSYVPVVLVGAAAGGVLAYFLFEPIMILVMSASKIKSSGMNIRIWYMIAAAGGITLLAGAVATLCAARIRRIEPCKMLQENI